MRAERCHGRRDEIGAFLLGHLDPNERAAFQAHLDSCSACRAEVAALRPVASLLELADPDRLDTAPPPLALGDRIFNAFESRRRVARGRRRRRLALAAAVCAATVIAIAVVVVAIRSPSSSPGESVAFHSLPPGIAISANLESRRFGTEIRLKVRGVRPGTVCTVWLRRRDGTRARAGSFRYLYEGGSDPVRLTSALDRPDAAGIAVRAGNRTFEANLPRVTHPEVD